MKKNKSTYISYKLYEMPTDEFPERIGIMIFPMGLIEEENGAYWIFCRNEKHAKLTEITLRHILLWEELRGATEDFLETKSKKRVAESICLSTNKVLELLDEAVDSFKLNARNMQLYEKYMKCRDKTKKKQTHGDIK